MFASYLFYQLIDLLLAALLTALFLRTVLPRVPLPAFASRCERSSAARLWCVEFPAYLAFHAVLMVFCKLILYRAILWITTRYFEPYTFSSFLNIGVVYYSALLVFPALGLWRAWRRSSSATQRWLSVSLASACIGLLVYMSFVTPRQLVIENVHVGIREWPADSPPLRIAVLADIQSPLLTSRERHAVETVRKLDPDVVLIPGDLVGQSLDDRLPVACARFVVENLTARFGIYAVNGDVDEYVRGGLEEVLADTPARVLNNESVVLNTPVPVEIVGLDPRNPLGYRRQIRKPSRASVRLALVHRPRHARDVLPGSFDLVIAGHCHGGQVVIPGFGPVITLSPMPRHIAAGGLHELEGGGRLYVSRGVGVEVGFAPPMRLFCPPEVTLLTLGPVREEDSLAVAASSRSQRSP